MSIGLIDCNNFFVSCEKVFRPDLDKKPIVVLSSNDSCVISRSQEAKRLGVPMGAPVFKYKDVIRRNKIILFSANFELYSEFSARIMSRLKNWFPRVEVYSIDEAFLEDNQLNIQLGLKIAQDIYKQIGIPVTFGIAPNKTLAKLACEYGKHNNKKAFLINQHNLVQILQKTALHDVWGVGGSSSAKFEKYGLKTAFDLYKESSQLVKNLMGINGIKIRNELRGEKVFALETERKAQESIMASRSFGQKTNNKDDLKQAIQTFTSLVVSRMQKQNLSCNGIEVFLIPAKGGYLKKPATMMEASSNYRSILEKAFEALDKIYHPLICYKKAGVRLLDLKNSKYKQVSLFESSEKIEKNKRLLKLEESINDIKSKWGKTSIQEANFLLPAKWRDRSRYRSPNYLSNWSDLAKVW